MDSYSGDAYGHLKNGDPHRAAASVVAKHPMAATIFIAVLVVLVIVLFAVMWHFRNRAMAASKSGFLNQNPAWQHGSDSAGQPFFEPDALKDIHAADLDARKRAAFNFNFNTGEWGANSLATAATGCTGYPNILEYQVSSAAQAATAADEWEALGAANGYHPSSAADGSMSADSMSDEDLHQKVTEATHA